MSRKTEEAKKARERKGVKGIQTVAFFSLGALAIAAFSQLDRQVLRVDRPLAAFGAGKNGRMIGPGTRGPILSADGRMVAESQDSYKMYLHQKTVPSAPAFFTDLSQSTGLPPAELTALRERKTAKGDPVTVAFEQGLTQAQVDRAKQVQEKWQTAGLSFEERPARLNPLGEAVADLVGSASFEEDLKKRKTNSVGLSGIESTLNGLLTGVGPVLRNDRVRIAGLTDDLKKQIEEASRENPERRGIALTIDSTMQQAAYEAVRKAVIRTQAAGGSALVLDPKTGDLVAAADFPPGRTVTHMTKEGPAGYLFAPTDAALEPGSTWKLVTLALAYHLRQLSPGDHLVSTAMLGMPAGRPIRNHDGLSFGTVTPGEALAHSCNTTFARVAMGIGEKQYYDWLKSTHVVEQKAGLGIHTETKGLFPYGKSIRDVASLGFGQGINLTPASLIGMFGMIANEGKFVSPRVIKSMAGIDIPSEVRGQFLSPEACRETLRGAEMVVSEKYGTGHKLAIPGIRLGGKTGTAQIIREEKAVGYRANFVGFVPAESPKYVVLVMVDRPSHADFYGASVAGPAFMDIVLALIDSGRVRANTVVQAQPLPLAKPMPLKSSQAEATDDAPKVSASSSSAKKSTSVRKSASPSRRRVASNGDSSTKGMSTAKVGSSSRRRTDPDPDAMKAASSRPRVRSADSDSDARPATSKRSSTRSRSSTSTLKKAGQREAAATEKKTGTRRISTKREDSDKPKSRRSSRT